VGEWTAADWSHELDQFDRLLFHGHELPFGRSEVVGERTPCLQGDFAALYPVLARRGFRYDASRSAPLGTWPWRERGIWAVPLPEIPLAGHTFDAIAMDYNFLANQVGERASQVEDETYRSLWNAFWTSYRGNRAPLQLGNHFETWNHWAYDRALERFLLRACRLPEVRSRIVACVQRWSRLPAIPELFLGLLAIGAAVVWFTVRGEAARATGAARRLRRETAPAGGDPRDTSSREQDVTAVVSATFAVRR
jgi:hypothetical protein